jgi:thymidine phosphorylase
MRAYDIIYKKRQNQELSKEEIDFIVACYMVIFQITKCLHF